MKKFLFRSLSITVLTLVLTWVVAVIADTPIFRLIFPESIILNDFEFSDFLFANRKSDTINEDIVIVNIGDLPRKDIAQMIENISNHHPAVIGLDIIFNCPYPRDSVNCAVGLDTAANNRLSFAIKNAKRVVMIESLMKSQALFNNPEASVYDYDSLETSDIAFTQHAVLGFGNLIANANNEEAQTIRYFHPSFQIDDTKHWSFAMQIARLYDSTSVGRVISRHNVIEGINFNGDTYGNPDDHPYYFPVIDWHDVMSSKFEDAQVSGKIVLMGFTGSILGELGNTHQKLYTPMNRTVVGKAGADMYGVVVQANIISMILEGDFIEEFSRMEEFLIAFVICFVHVMLLLYIHSRIPLWYDVASIAFILFQLFFYAFLRIELFAEFNMKLNLSLTIGTLAIAGLTVNLYHGLLPAYAEKILNWKLKKNQ